MKKLLTLITSLAAIATSTAVLAADLPSKRVAPVAPVAPVFTWTGFYAGVNAGVNWSSRNINSTWYDVTGVTSAATLASYAPLPYANQRTGFIGGIQVGYNYQINQFVIGAEADFMGMAANQTSSSAPLDGGSFVTVSTTKVQQQWLGTVRARAGFAVDRFLVYATGGLAYGSTKVSTISNDYTTTGTLIDSWTGQKTSTDAGYVVGAGLEYAFTNNWLLRAEYLYYNLGKASANATLSGSDLFTKVSTTIDGNIVRAAISYKF